MAQGVRGRGARARERKSRWKERILTEQAAGATPPAQKKPGGHGAVLLDEPRGHEMPGEQAPHVRRDVE